jgi:molybdopterin converting factor small subunit
VRVRILAFAQLRDWFGFGQRDVDVAPGATVAALWSQLTGDGVTPDGLRETTRFARNGALVDAQTTLVDGDEVAFMPPVGGG